MVWKGSTRAPGLDLLPPVIDSPALLSAFLPRLQQSAWLALDTEADSLHAYPEKLCLLQVGLPEGPELVDPLADLDLSQVWPEFRRREIIMHGADYDLRLLKAGPGFVPETIFDTMLAARILGHERFGLADLVQHFMGVTLEKGSQKANWAQRPLTEKMSQYACNDVLYLKPIADALRALMIAKGRLGWHAQQCAQLIVDNSQFAAPDADRIWRIKGSNHLPPPVLAVLRELWHWREGEARRRSRPPFFVIPHDTLLQIACVAGQGGNFHDLLPRRISDQRRQGIIDAIHRGGQQPPASHPRPIPPAPRLRLTGPQAQRLAQLQRHRDARAADLAIDPTLIASRAMMLEMVTENHLAHLLPWQQDLMAM